MRLAVLSAFVLVLGGSAALATATVPAKSATIRVIAVQRTGSVSPGATSPVSVLCPGKYTAISWGFQAITPVQGKLLALTYVSAAPIVRKTGGSAGWIARFKNATATPLGVRVAATCAEGRGITIRGEGGRARAGTSKNPELFVGIESTTARVAAGASATIKTFCGRDGVFLSVGHSLGDTTLLADEPILGKPPGWQTRVVNSTGTEQTVRLTVICLQSSGLKVGIKAPGVSRSGQILIDATGTHTLTVPAAGSSFFFHCLKGVNTDISYRTTPVAGSTPPSMGAWFHRPVATGSETLDPKQRTIAFLGGGSETSVFLRALCLKTNAGFTVPKPGTIDLKITY